MRLKLTLFIAMVVTLNVTTASAQTFKNKEVQSIIDSTLSVMKNNAVNRNNVDWNILKQNAYKQATNLNSPYELGDVMRNVYKSIDDFHGKFFYRDSVFNWPGNKTQIPKAVMTEWNKGSGIKTAVINNIGYLRVPSIMGGGRADFDRKAQQLNDSLCAILSNNPKGMILDLRLDGGGAMFPMILGLKQLLGEGKLGSFQTKEINEWGIKGNEFLMGNVLAAITPKCLINAETMPCVLLIGPGTASSGEFLAMTFKGRKNTLFLGDVTNGSVTSVNGYQINNSAFINLSIGYGADRADNLYTRPLSPDVVVKGNDEFNDLANDTKVKAAVRWLATQQ